jgi:3,4-dihydroxy 2-butanone 4-phosphate synthase/GTP cyclohydrolase II
VSALRGTVLAVATMPLSTVHGDFIVHRFHDLASGQPVLAVTRGALRGPEPVLARVHSSCVTSEAYGACDCDCAEQLDAALAHVAAAGRGIVFYLPQEGRGFGFSAKARDRMLVQASRQRLTTFDAYAAMGLPRDARRYDQVATVCRLLGVAAPLRLITNNPEKVAALMADGVVVDGTVTVDGFASPFNRHYLAAKSGSGHTLTARLDDLDTAELPEPVEAFEPHPIADAPRFLRLATYLLPVRLQTLAWFRLHLYFDLEVRSERVVLTHGRAAGALVRVQPEELLERFPLRLPVGKRRWRAAAEAMVAHGGGATLFVHGGVDADSATLDLLARHVDGPRARPIVAGPADEALAAALARRGIEATDPLVLP